MAQPTGVVLYEGPSNLNKKKRIGVILTFDSGNKKTGDMPQVWILAKGEPPLEAARSGEDVAVCGACPHRPVNGDSCYVRLDQAPTVVYKKWQAGGYPLVEDEAALEEHLRRVRSPSIRVGAYGDPAAMPLAVMEQLARVAKRLDRFVLAYTHQWKNAKGKPFKGLLMASCDTQKDADKAKAAGWRYFLVRNPQPDEAPPEEELCAAIAGPVQCRECNACDASRPGPNIWVPVHGAKHKISNYLKWAEAK